MSVMGATKWWAKEYLCSAGGHLANLNVTRTRSTSFLFMTSHRKRSVTCQWTSWTGQLVCYLRNLSQLILTFRPRRCYLSALLTINTSLCRPLLVDTAFRTFQTLIPTSPSFLAMRAVHLFL